MSILGGELLSEIRNATSETINYGRLAELLDRMIKGTNQLGNVLGSDPNGMISPPDPPTNIQVSAGSDHIHVTLTDPSTRGRGLNYFLEWSAGDPSFLAPQVEHLGVGRQRVLALPAKDASGTTINYFVRGYSMYPGSEKASPHIIFGTLDSPTPIQLSGSSMLSVLQSTGAGTASTTGERGGTGFGPSQFSQPERNKSWLSGHLSQATRERLKRFIIEVDCLLLVYQMSYRLYFSWSSSVRRMGKLWWLARWNW
jgi:hypothetical protein